jgi:hypothetical protein
MAAGSTRGFGLMNRVVNTAIIHALRGPMGSRLGRRLAVVDYSGRRSGRACQLVAQYVVDGRTLRLDVGMPERKTWWRNFEEPYPARVRLAGLEHDVLAHVVHDGGRVRVVADL